MGRATHIESRLMATTAADRRASTDDAGIAIEARPSGLLVVAGICERRVCVCVCACVCSVLGAGHIHAEQARPDTGWQCKQLEDPLRPSTS